MGKINIDELREISLESYDKWFERWYKKQGLADKLKKSAMQGYTSYSYVINNSYSDYEKRRMNNPLLIKKLQGKLDDFEVYRVEPKKYTKRILNKELGIGYTDAKIVISWDRS